MNYINLLNISAKKAGNLACMGLDPQTQYLPKNYDITDFFKTIFEKMLDLKLTPSAFKPNICYYAAMNNPLKKDFSGYIALAETLDLIKPMFPGIPVILDAKRGDIATSSLHYAMECFDGWNADAVTISPYMGSDSITPFLENKYITKGVYILNRTSNPGGADFQNLKLKNGGFLYEEVAKKIAEYSNQFPGTGAVVGATGMDELAAIAKIYSASNSLPLLIPGVGSQGGSACDVLATLKNLDYNLNYIRINSSSGLTFPWKKQKTAPENWLDCCITAIKKFLQETKHF
ncbi:MAG: orotidine-5'-phosphate decarboxylase [Treponema sp.]|nr:MAG: orotidine-5'-phosphate decarboxylase [Treponema sp.]